VAVVVAVVVVIVVVVGVGVVGHNTNFGRYFMRRCFNHLIRKKLSNEQPDLYKTICESLTNCFPSTSTIQYWQLDAFFQESQQR